MERRNSSRPSTLRTLRTNLLALHKLDLGRKWRKRKEDKNVTKKPFVFDEFVPQRELDYHDKGILDVFQIENMLDIFVEDCYLGGIKRVLIITGKGIVVRAVVKKHLKKVKYVKSFNMAGYFNGGSGAFEVELIS